MWLQTHLSAEVQNLVFQIFLDLKSHHPWPLTFCLGLMGGFFLGGQQYCRTSGFLMLLCNPEGQFRGSVSWLSQSLCWAFHRRSNCLPCIVETLRIYLLRLLVGAVGGTGGPVWKEYWPKYLQRCDFLIPHNREVSKYETPNQNIHISLQDLPPLIYILLYQPLWFFRMTHLHQVSF